MLALHTDMALPKDISRVKLQVLSAGAVKFDRTFTVGADGEAKIPATFAIVAPEGQSPTVEVRLIGLGGNKARTFSKVITTVPKDRIATLDMPIQWLCDGTAQMIDGQTFESTCPPVGDIETSCVAGVCQDVNFPEAKMPTFSPPAVFGGGKDAMDPSGKCFDTASCFGPGFDVEPNSACRVTIQAPPRRPLNFALVPTKPNEGICNASGDCYVPLDQNEIFGWKELSNVDRGGEGGAAGDSGLGEGGAGGDSGQPDFGPGSVERTFQLPPGVCQRRRDGLVKSIRATLACDLKTEGVPVCGDWYSSAAAHVTPETSTMTGGGSMTTSCPEFKPGTSLGAISDNVVFDGTLQAAADIKSLADQLAKEVFEACSGIVRDLGGTPPASAVTPSTALVKNACTQAQAELTMAGGTTAGNDWSVLLTPGKCGVSVDQQALCESACSSATCASTDPSPGERCQWLGGTCQGSCDGECAGSRDKDVDCSGECDGICVGTCQGTCVLPDGTPGGPNCGGWCTGNCVGSCAGTCSPSADTCQGTCWLDGGACLGTLTDLTCEAPLAPRACLGDCGTLCGARAALDQTCQAPNAEVFGEVPPLVRTALDAHYWKLYDVVNRSSGFSNSAALVSQLSASIAQNGALLRDAHAAACFVAAQNAIAAAGESIGATITAASTTATSITSGAGGGVCQASDAETACIRCVKSSCCDGYVDCALDPACIGADSTGEFGCVSECYQSGAGNASVCEEGSRCKPSGSASFSSATTALLACAHASCQSQCLTAICPPTQSLCSGTCVNPLTDAQNCGGCGRACATGQTCADGACTCPASTTLCSTGCVSTTTDRTNCGGCGVVCAASQVCSNGTCVASAGAGGASGAGGTTAGLGGSAGAASGGAVARGGGGGTSGSGAGGSAGFAGSASASGNVGGTVCGDGNREEPEQCDPGPEGETATCDSDCTIAECGDSHRNAAAGEDCDEGPNNGSGSCNQDCQIIFQ